MPEIDPDMAERAVSVYGQGNDAYEDFPVLKAFQQYIDAEQTKARKRMVLICAFFGILMFIVISVFVMLLVSANSRNQMLNDRLVEYAMKDRQPAGSAVVVQPTQDTSAILALTAKLDELKAKFAENQAATEKIVSNVSANVKANDKRSPSQETVKTGPTPEELEIERLKAALAAEKEKSAVEREKQRQAELEAYRRKHYPELYEQPKPKSEKRKSPRSRDEEVDNDDDLLKEVDEILKAGEAVSYFEDGEEDRAKKPAAPLRTSEKSPKKEYSIPVDIRGSSNRWNIPND